MDAPWLLLAFALVWLATPAAVAAYATQVSEIVDILNERTFCPEGSMMLGGGLDPQDLDSMVVSVLLPLDPVGGTLPASFTVVVLDLASPHDVYRVAAICGDLPEREIVSESFPVPAGGTGVGSVQCPLGKVAVSGGLSQTGGSALDGSASTTAPYFPSDLFDPDLTDRAAGLDVAPTGWKSARRSEGPAGTGIAVAVCAAAAGNVVTVVEDDVVAPGTTQVGLAFCPDATTALGGGVDAVDRSTLRVASSAPIFAGFPIFKTLFAKAEGTAGDPIGWRVALRNDGAVSKPFKVAAVCAPEPGAAASAFIAIGACLARRRRA